MRSKFKDFAKRARALGLGLAVAGSSILGNVALPIQAQAAEAKVVKFDSEQFVTQAMKHLGDGYNQNNRMAAGISDCTSFIYKVLRECGFDGGSGIYQADNTIPSSTYDWISDITNKALQLKNADGEYVEVVYTTSYADYLTKKDDTANYGGKLLVCTQAVDSDTLSTADLPPGTIVITQATASSAAHGQIVIGKPGSYGVPANFTSAGGQDYYEKLTSYMNSFYGAMKDMYGLTSDQANKMVVIPADTSGVVTAVNKQNALTNTWKYADWGYFVEGDFSNRREDVISTIISSNMVSLNDVNWVIDSASNIYGTRLKMGISGKGGATVNAYLVTPVENPASTTYTVTKQGTAVTNGTIKSISFQLKADGGNSIYYENGTALSSSAKTVTIDFAYGKTSKSYTWKDLQKYNSNGTEIVYSAVETKVIYKDSSGTERTVTATSNPSIADIFGTTINRVDSEDGDEEKLGNYYNTEYGRFQIKKVDDKNNPVGATFYVYSDSTCKTKLGQFTCSTKNGIGSYTTTWAAQAGLSKTVYFKEYDSDNDGYITVSGKQYKVDPKVHTVVMNGVSETANLGKATWKIDGVSYSGSTSDKEIENDEYITHEVKKTFNGDASSYVTAITVQLYRNISGGASSKVGSEVTLNSANSWDYKWNNLPKYDASNQEYHYYAVETSISYKTAAGTSGKLATEADMNKYFTRTTDNAANATTIKSKTTLTNALVKLYGAVQIEKVDKENNIIKIPGVQYGVYGLYENGTLSDKIGNNIVTGDEGIATYTVTGTWYKLDGETKTVYIKELQTVAPYVLDDTVYTVVISGSDVDAMHCTVNVTEPTGVTVNNNSDYTKISVYKQENVEKYGQITVTKTGEVLSGFTAGNTNGDIASYTNGQFTYVQQNMAGATFELRAAQTITNQSGTVSYQANELIETLTTSGNGTAVFGVNKALPMGTYKIIETKAPAGQTIPDVHEWTVTLTYDNSNAGVVTNGKTVNDKLANASVSVVKIDGDTKKALENAIYGLYAGADLKNYDETVIVSKDQLIAVVTTDVNGEGTFDIDIPYGDYYVKELQTRDGYTLSDEMYELTFRYVGQDRYESEVAEFTHTFTDERMSAEITIFKKDAVTTVAQGDGSLAGAVYGLYAREDIIHPDGKSGVVYVAGTEVCQLTTEEYVTADGITVGMASVNNLYLGKYYVKEITPSEGYLLDSNEYELTVVSDGVNHVSTTIAIEKNTEVITDETSVYEQTIMRGFRFAKVSGEKGDSELTDLDGAGFSVYLVKDLVKNADGSINYDASPKTPVNVRGDLVAYSTYVYMFKNEDGTWSETTEDNEEAVRIAAYVEAMPIVYGEYLVHETVVPENKKQASDFIVTISKEDVRTNANGIAVENYNTPKQYSVVFDAEFAAKIKLIKIDEETGRQIALSGTVFKIFNMTTGEYVSYYDVDPVTFEKVLVDKWSTNDNGFLITSQTLPVGKYRMEEQLAPNGYYNSETAEGIQSEFTIDLNSSFVFEGNDVESFYDADLDCYILPVKYYDSSVKGTIEVRKSGEVLNAYHTETGIFEYVEMGLAGAVYEVYAVGNIYSADHAVDENGNRYVIYENGALVGKITTGADGTGSLQNLPLNEDGSMYKIVEVQAPDGYLLGDNEKSAQYATLVYNGQNVKVVFDSDGVENHFKNDRPAYDIHVVKYEKDAEGNVLYDKPLAGTVFEFITTTDIKNYKDEVIVTAGTVLAKDLVTDATGLAAVPDAIKVPFGSYAFIETAVTPGYVLDSTPINVSYSYANQNTPVISVAAEQANDYTTITISKIDSNEAYAGTLIAGAVMQLLTSDGKVYDEWTTVAGQAHVLTRVPAGNYILHEVSAPLGYVKAADITIEVKAIKDVQSYEMFDDHTKIELSKIDEDGQFVEGAVISLYKTDQNGNRTDEVLIVTMPDCLNVPAIFTDTTQVLRLDYVPVGTYIMHEDVTPAGYARAKDIKIVVTEKAEIQVFEAMVDKPITLELSKISVAGDEEIEGAELVIYKATRDENGNWVNTGEVYVTPKGETCAWTSTSERHVIKYMEDGFYILHEVTAPTEDGYVKVSDVNFAIADTEIIQFVQMVDEITKVSFSKTVLGDDTEFVEGATLGLYRMMEQSIEGVYAYMLQGINIQEMNWTKTQENVYEGTSSDNQVVVTLWDDGAGYCISIITTREENPKGCAERILYDEVTAEMRGAEPITIQVRADKAIRTWITGETGHTETRLPVGKYVLVEEVTPAGYVTAEPVYFSVVETADLQFVNMEDAKILQPIKKTDAVTGEEVEGATLTVYKAVKNEEGEWIRGEILTIDDEEITWVSTKEEHIIRRIPAGDYILAEITAPTEHGYVTANDIHFTVNADLRIQEVVEMKDEHTEVHISKTDFTTGEEIEGAKLAIYKADENGIATGEVLYEWITDGSDYVIEYMPVGDYVLVETQAPYEQGYTTAEEVNFSVLDSGEIQKVEMKDKKTEVSISKKDISDSKELPGAKLTLTDKDGQIIDTWISENAPHMITGLIPGMTYTLTEVSAPEGYEVAESITFTVLDDMSVQHVIMYDKPDKPNTPNTPILGIEDHSTAGGMVLLGLAGISLAGAAVIGRKREEDKE